MKAVKQGVHVVTKVAGKYILIGNEGKTFKLTPRPPSLPTELKAIHKDKTFKLDNGIEFKLSDKFPKLFEEAKKENTHKNS